MGLTRRSTMYSSRPLLGSPTQYQRNTQTLPRTGLPNTSRTLTSSTSTNFPPPIRFQNLMSGVNNLLSFTNTLMMSMLYSLMPSELWKDLMSQAKVEELRNVMRDHFIHEEKHVCESKEISWDYCKDHKKKHVLFSERLAKMDAPVDLSEIKWAQNWLAQHIMNTDFGYRGKLAHPVPEPYVWDESFATDYPQIDAEHDVLFQKILAVSQHPEDAAILEDLKRLLKEHFDYEEGKFCEIPHFNCVDHKMKHYKFWVIFEQQQ